jgi:outer membrane protein assembly factor BamB
MIRTKYVPLFVLGAALVGCSSKEPLAGTRQELIVSELGAGAANDKDSSPVVIDSSEEKSLEFVQAHFNSSHCYSPFKLSNSPSEIWRSDLDFESTEAIKMTAAPVVAEGKVFCLDAAGVAYAFDQKTGAKLWRKSLIIVGKDGQIGGAIAYDNGRLIVSSSFAEAFSLDAKTGNILWRIKLSAPCKGDGITIHAGKAFLMCSNSSLHRIDIDTGKILWSHSGMTADSTFIGSASPAVDDGVVYFAYPSGEVFALLEETGAVVWEAMLSKFSLTNATRAFTHPRACPVAKDGVVYFVSANEQTSAFSAKDGKLLWKSDFGGVQTPIVSGNSIFVFGSKSQLVCLNKNTGKKRWLAKLAQEDGDVADWLGMILVKDRIATISPKGRMIFVSPHDGKIKNVLDIGDDVTVNPIVADGTMFVPTNGGKIAAFR